MTAPKAAEVETATFDNAKFGYVLVIMLGTVSSATRQQMQGMWNPRFCTADAGEKAILMFDQLQAEMDHWRAFIAAAHPSKGE